MNIYHAFFTLKAGTSDMAFVENLRAYMTHLKERGDIASWRLMRRKLGLGPEEFGEFHLMIEVEGLAQLDTAFSHVATRSGEVEQKHYAVNHMIERVKFALYRDFPDPERNAGDEKF